MDIQSHCMGCGECAALCPQGAITQAEAHAGSSAGHLVGQLYDKAAGSATGRAAGKAGTGIYRVNREACVECGVCLDAAKCPSGALVETFGPEEEIKKLFGRLVTAKEKKSSGRLGSLDLKTCDAKGGLPIGTVQIRLELGRPVGPPRLGQVEDFRARLGGYPVRPQTSYLGLLADTPNGPALPPELRNLTVLTVCLEADLPPHGAGELVAEAKRVAKGLGISLSVNLLAQPGLVPALAGSLFGQQPMGPRVKANLGLAWPAQNTGLDTGLDTGQGSPKASDGCLP